MGRVDGIEGAAERGNRFILNIWIDSEKILND